MLGSLSPRAGNSLEGTTAGSGSNLLPDISSKWVHFHFAASCLGSLFGRSDASLIRLAELYGRDRNASLLHDVKDCLAQRCTEATSATKQRSAAARERAGSRSNIDSGKVRRNTFGIWTNIPHPNSWPSSKFHQQAGSCVASPVADIPSGRRFTS